MKASSIASRLFDRLRPQDKPQVPDFADYGTDFALDLSIEQVDAASNGANNEAATDSPLWWEQLGSRRPAPGL